jgi:RNA polymerase sigma-70 factor (ECF subfamily)
VNDDRLIDDALAGDTEAFGQLVQKYQDRLYNALVHIVGCTEEARDLVQDAFVQAFVKLDSFKRTSTFYTWLYRIAMNATVSRFRRRRPVQSVEQTREMSGDEPVDLASPEDRLEQEERALEVHRALAELSTEHRAILVMREVDGFSYEDIAEMMEVPVGTVRSRLHRARLQLREQLKAVLPDEV